MGKLFHSENKLKKLIKLTKLILCLGLFVPQLSNALSYTISGISGDLYKNVDLRLSLLSKQDLNLSINETKLISKNIIEALQPFGYYTPQIKFNNKRIYINKGIPVKIASIALTIDGMGKKIFNKLRHKLPIEVGTIFISENYEDAKQQLFDIAEQHGYLDAHMLLSQAIVNPASHQVTINLHFTTGKLYHFSNITFSNNTFYSHDFLARYLHFHKGSPYSTAKLLKLNESLHGSGYFAKVNVKPKISKTTTKVPVNIYLKDLPSQNYTLGIGFATDTGARGRAGWQWRRVTPYGHKFQALLQGSEKQNSLQALYYIPGSDPTKEQYTISASVFQLNYPVGDSQGKLLSAAKIFHDDNKQYTLSLNALQEEYNYSGGTKRKSTIIYPTAKFEIKRIQAPLFSKSGFVFNSQIRGSSKNLGSDLNLGQIEAGAKVAIWLPTHSRLFFRGHLSLTNTKNIYQLPLSLQILAGGSDSIRGYNYQSIGPGKHQLVGSAEIQQEIIENWYATSFYDVGSVYNPKAKEWRRGIGGGAMWVSPVGPIRISIAQAIDDVGKPFRIIFSMGPDL